MFQLLVSVAKEEGNADVSRDYHVLRRMIDNDEQFIEVTALGEELAEEVIRLAVTIIKIIIKINNSISFY